MIERFVQAVQLADAREETPAQTRERLAPLFPRPAVRRMTQLGLLVGSVLQQLPLRAGDGVVYASTYAETRALEDYLASFPTPSPALFQTSIHPSAVEQAFIARAQPVRWFVPLTGGASLGRQALLSTLLAPVSDVVLVGGEERGTWLLEKQLASDCSFAFGLRLTADREGALARLALEDAPADAMTQPPQRTPPAAENTATLPGLLATLQRRENLVFFAGSGKRIVLSWLA